MKIPVIWKSYNPDSPAKGYWDQGLIEDLLTNKMWYPANGFEFLHVNNFEQAYTFNDGAIVVIPARSNVDYINEINEDIKKLKWVVLMLTGDEENVFPVNQLIHDNMIVYVMSPRENLDKEKYRVLGTGYPPQLHKILDNSEVPEKYFAWFFAGQITHQRREMMAEQLNNMHNDIQNHGMHGLSSFTDGFTKGAPHSEYYEDMSRARVAPCPSGPETPDTFRLFEALELGCVPIADTRVTKGGFSDNYWSFFFGEQPPFPIIKEYEDLPGYIEDQYSKFPVNNNRIYAWWQNKKRELAYQLNNDIRSLVEDVNSDIDAQSVKDGITVIIPVSPIKSHPRTHILDETIESIRYHLPNSEIIVTFDGVRPESEHRRADYEEFIRHMLWKFNFHYTNILPVIFDEHQHQTGMARAVLDKVKTPTILYVEQDTPLVTDMDIPFSSLEVDVINGISDCVRLHHEGVIPQDHSHMMLGMENCDTPLMRTCQWSQRPHLASKAFYRRILENCFSENAKSFIEDKMHGIVHQAYLQDGLMGWEQYRIHIYHPEGNIKRSYHTDGRAGEQKFDDTQIF